MFIENCAMFEIPLGKHRNPGSNSMLIQIIDLDLDFPVPKHNFKEVRQYKFLDNDSDQTGINNDQAEQIARSLQFALKQKMNVIVHCVMGICRSGAVVEVGTIIGFEDTGKYRQPNTRVKKMLMKHLNLLPLGIDF